MSKTMALRVAYLAMAMAWASALPANGPRHPQIKATIAPLLDRRPMTNRLVPQKTVEITRIPQGWITFRNVSTWTLARRPTVVQSRGAIEPDVAGVYAVMTSPTGGNGKCPVKVSAVIDPTVPRSHGFTPASIKMDDVKPPAGGYALDPYTPPMRWEPTSRTDTAAYLEGATYWLKFRKGVGFCWSGFHGHIMMRGPAGIDPITGAEVASFRPPD